MQALHNCDKIVSKGMIRTCLRAMLGLVFLMLHPCFSVRRVTMSLNTLEKCRYQAREATASQDFLSCHLPWWTHPRWICTFFGTSGTKEPLPYLSVIVLNYTAFAWLFPGESPQKHCSYSSNLCNHFTVVYLSLHWNFFLVQSTEEFSFWEFISKEQISRILYVIF